MKLNGSNFGPSVAARVLAAIGYLLTASASLGEALSFRWRTEVSSAAPYEAQAMQGESFALEATLVQYGAPLTGDATATFYYQTKQMAATEWFSAPAAWDAATATASVTWSPALDVGQSAYRWFFGIDTAQGHNYRAYGTLRLKPSPGFSPALLEPIDLRETLKAELYAQLQADLSAAFSTDLQAEAAAREEADGAITEAVNALQDDLSTHNHDGAYLKLTGGTMSGTILSALSKASDPGITITLGQGDRYYAKHTQAGIQARRAISDPEEFYAFFSVSGTNQIARLGDLEPLATKAALAAKAELEHTHEMGDVDGLETALAAKAALEHTHSQYLTSYTESDPTVSAWAKAATKPTYTAAEVGAQPAGKYVTYDTTSHSLDAVSKETSFAGGLRTDSFKTLYGTPFFNTVSDYGFNITGFYRLNGYRTENNPLLEWDVKTQKSKLAVTTVYEGGTSLSNKYAPISHTHTVSAITDFPATWDWAKLTNKPTTFTPAEHNHDGTYLKLTGGTVTGNVTFSGTSNYMEKLEFGGSAGAAGLMTRGISGRTYSNSPGGAKDSLFLNYDGSTISHSTYWNYGNDASRGVFVCGGAPGGLVVRRIDLETILKDYSPAAHTHAIADTTGLQAALEALAPLSSVTCTTNNVTYIWQWDEAAGTFALRASE